MTGHQINSLVGDLVAMAQAMERLPLAEGELSEARSEITKLCDTIQRLELKLLDRANEITTLQSTIRDTEAKLDSAETMFLEADDRTSRALDFIKATFGNAGSLIQALEPPREPATPDVSVSPVHEVTPEGLAAWQSPFASTQSGNQVSASAPTTASDGSSLATLKAEQDHHDDFGSTPAPEVAPMPDPTVRTTPSSSCGEASPASASTVGDGSTEPGGFSAPPIDRGKYHGMSYSDAHKHFGTAFPWPSKDEWLSDGGSLDQFYA